jgi:hypothetical protein
MEDIIYNETQSFFEKYQKVVHTSVTKFYINSFVRAKMNNEQLKKEFVNIYKKQPKPMEFFMFSMRVNFASSNSDFVQYNIEDIDMNFNHKVNKMIKKLNLTSIETISSKIIEIDNGFKFEMNINNKKITAKIEYSENPRKYNFQFRIT